MGFVQRQVDDVFVRTDNFQVVRDENKLKELLKTGLVVKRDYLGIIIYSEIDFSEFYRKHCERIPNDNKEFTVLVDKGDNKPEKEIVKKLIEIALLGKATKDKFNKILIPIPILQGKEYFGREYFNKKFTSENFKIRFRFRDVKEVTIKELGEEFENVKKLWKSSFTPNCDYSINYIWLIGHTDIVQA